MDSRNRPLTNGATAIRDGRGRFVPGNPGSPGRPPKSVEIAHAEAARAGCPPEDFEQVIRKMSELAKGGNVQAANLLARVFGLGRDEHTPATEQGSSIGEALAGHPEIIEDIDKLMSKVFGTSTQPSGTLGSS